MSPALMPGGFAPRFGAFVLGLILFVNSAVISESLVPGYLIRWGYVWRPTPLCRATFVTIHNKKNSFSKRFTRVAATGCFSPGEHDAGFWWLESLRPIEVRAIGNPFGRDAWNHTIPPNLISPDPKAIANTWYGHINKPMYCNYQCVAWAEVAFNDLVAELGLIFAGAAVIVGLVDSVTAAVGWSMVTEDSSIKTLKHLNDVTSRFGWVPCGLRGLARMCCSIFHKSRLFCALQLIGIDWCARWCAKTLDVDGYFTVDYYVTMVLCQSLFLATMLRLWNPFTIAPVVYTKNMWTQGNDTFLDLTVDPPVLKTIDLYEWLHLTTLQRTHYVAIYARRVGFDSIKDKKDDEKEDSNRKQDKERHWRETPDCCYKTVHALHRAFVCCLYCGRHELKTKGEAEETMSVICLKSFHGVRMIVNIRNGQEFEDKERIRIPKYTEGTVTGKTVNKLIVQWNLKGYDREVETKADPLYVSQWSPEWKEYMDEMGADDDDDDSDEEDEA